MKMSNDLYFQYANSSSAKNSLDEDDHSQMVLLKLGAKCSNESLESTTNDFVSCNDLCSSYSRCNYVSYGDSTAGDNCILTSKCNMERASEVENGKNYSIYIKSSHMQHANKHGLDESDDEIEYSWENMKYFFILFLIIFLMIVFGLGKRRKYYLVYQK